MIKRIEGTATDVTVALDYGPNNHQPILWIGIEGEKVNSRLYACLDKAAVNELIVELQKRVSEM